MAELYFQDIISKKLHGAFSSDSQFFEQKFPSGITDNFS